MSALTQSVIYISLTREHPAEILVRRAGTIFCGALVIAYIYLASTSVFYAVLQRTAEGDIESARTELSQLEKNYFALSRNVDKNAATGLSLVKVSNKTFAERSVHVGVAPNESGL